MEIYHSDHEESQFDSWMESPWALLIIIGMAMIILPINLGLFFRKK